MKPILLIGGTVVGDRNYDPMVYEALHDLKRTLGSRYLHWSRQAETEPESEYWFTKMVELNREVQQVDENNLAAVEAKRVEIRRILSEMPANAPKVDL